MLATAPTAVQREREAADARALVALVDALFLLAGAAYGARRLKALPKTYISEIAFPLDFCAKLVACAALFLSYTVQWLLTVAQRVWWTSDHGDQHSPTALVDASELFAALEALAWGMASTILWMEYRRSRTPSAFLRSFWLVKWIGSVYALVVFQSFTLAPPDGSALLRRHAGVTLALALDGARFAAMTVLAVLCLVRPTPISLDLISLPSDVLSPTALLHSCNSHRRLSNYDSFKDFDWMLKSAVDLAPNTSLKAFVSAADEQSLERSVSTHSSGGLAPAIAVTIPSSTMAVWGKNEFVSYKIVVHTEGDAWTVRRHYSDFVALHDELPDEIRASCALPADREASSKRRGFLSWKGRPRSMKSRLESYLRLVLGHPALEPNASQGLCDFLEMEYVDDTLSRSYHSAPRI
ncbi:hypothetical protein PybrP1_008530 [[Pythium] brassicae (nom. inval.)]|nr:hypothetical protein PybrP1_008530 [[Pythium] brassicae (nom. inval.)]